MNEVQHFVLNFIHYVALQTKIDSIACKLKIERLYEHVYKWYVLFPII